MRKILKKIKVLLQRKRNAKRVGISFVRASSWQLPKKILVQNKEIPLKLSEDNSTRTSFADIFFDDVYGLNFFKKNAPFINKIADIGANQGLFSIASNNIFGAQIHAYEPNTALMNSLNHNVQQFNVSCFNEAVGLTNGFIEMEEGKDSLHGKAILSAAGVIPQVSLQTVIKRMDERVDLLKLDCEGAEWEILKDKASLNKIRAITMEYHTDDMHDHNYIKSVLKDAGFKILHYEISGATWGIVWAINAREIGGRKTG